MSIKAAIFTYREFLMTLLPMQWKSMAAEPLIIELCLQFKAASCIETSSVERNQLQIYHALKSDIVKTRIPNLGFIKHVQPSLPLKLACYAFYLNSLLIQVYISL